MKKIIFMIVFLLPLNCFADECSPYLNNLDINEYKLTPKFNKYNNIYTTFINDDTFTLDIIYKRETNNSLISIIGNEFLEDQSNIIIKVKCNKKEEVYQIIVNKTSAEKVFYETNSIENTFSLKNKIVTIVGVSLFTILLIIIVGIMLFRKKKSI